MENPNESRIGREMENCKCSEFSSGKSKLSEIFAAADDTRAADALLKVALCPRKPQFDLAVNDTIPKILSWEC